MKFLKFLLYFLFSTALFAGNLELCWKHTQNAKGYYLKYYYDSGLEVVTDIGYRTNYVMDIDNNRDYVFFIQSYDKYRNFSPWSKPVTFRIRDKNYVPILQPPSLMVKELKPRKKTYD